MEVRGQLGLLIGVSVITLFEFVIFLLDELAKGLDKETIPEEENKS